MSTIDFDCTLCTYMNLSCNQIYKVPKFGNSMKVLPYLYSFQMIRSEEIGCEAIIA